MPSDWSIRTQLTAIMLAIIIPLAALGTYSIFSEFRVSSVRADENMMSIADVTAANLRAFLVDAEETLVDLAESEALRSMDPGRCAAFLQPIRPVLSQYTNVFLSDQERRLVCSSLGIPKNTVPVHAGSEWFPGMGSDGLFTLGKPHVSVLTGDWVSLLVYPVRDLTGSTSGTVGLSLDLVRFQRLLVTPDLPPGAVITIDDRDGVVVARSLDPEAWVGRVLPASDVPDEILGGRRGVTRTEGADGIDRAWAFAEISETPWRVWVGVPTSWVYAPVREAATRNALFASVIFLLVGLLAYRFQARIVRSLTVLAEGARLSARGDSTAIALEGPAEVVEVAAEFNRTLAARGRAELRYRSIMENAAFGIYLSTSEGRFLEVNPALVEMLGYDSVEELREVPVPSLYRSPPRRDALIAEHAGFRKIEVVEVEWLRKDGSPITLLLNGNMIRDHGGAHDATDQEVFEVIAEDVTERRHLEEQLRHSQKMEAVGRIAGGVAHDFNNLLTVITAEADLLLEKLEEEEPHRQGIIEIRRAADRATGLTRQLLAFSRKSVLRPTVLDPNRIIREMDGMLARLTGRRMKIQTSLDPNLRAARLDPGQLQQVLMNLVLNARDAMGGEGTVEIATGNVALDAQRATATVGLEAGAYIFISVRDEGPGIPEEIQGRVFEPFFTTKPEGEGTGLGLATVYGIATQSGGHVDLQSAPGSGTIFTVYFPVAPGERTAQGAGARPSEQEDDGTSATILVTEDEDAVRRVVARILRGKGYTVLEAHDAEQALEIARTSAKPVHLLLSDVVMPGMQGPELADEILKILPSIRTVLMSGHSDNPELHRVGADGRVPFLPKPFAADELIRTIRNVLEDPIPEDPPVEAVRG